MCISPSSYRKLAELIGNYVIRVCHVNNYKVLKGDMGKLCAYEKKTGPWKRVGILLSNKHNKEVFLESPSQSFFFFFYWSWWQTYFWMCRLCARCPPPNMCSPLSSSLDRVFAMSDQPHMKILVSHHSNAPLWRKFSKFSILFLPLGCGMLACQISKKSHMQFHIRCLHNQPSNT